MFICYRNLGVGRMNIQFLRFFLNANVRFKDKPSKVVGEEGDSSLDVGPVFTN